MCKKNTVSTQSKGTACKRADFTRFIAFYWFTGTHAKTDVEMMFLRGGGRKDSRAKLKEASEASTTKPSALHKQQQQWPTAVYENVPSITLSLLLTSNDHVSSLLWCL